MGRQQATGIVGNSRNQMFPRWDCTLVPWMQYGRFTIVQAQEHSPRFTRILTPFLGDVCFTQPALHSVYTTSLPNTLKAINRGSSTGDYLSELISVDDDTIDIDDIIRQLDLEDFVDRNATDSLFPFQKRILSIQFEGLIILCSSLGLLDREWEWPYATTGT